MKYPEIWNERNFKYSSWGDMKGVKFVPDRKPWAEYILGGACFAAVLIALMFL